MAAGERILLPGVEKSFNLSPRSIQLLLHFRGWRLLSGLIRAFFHDSPDDQDRSTAIIITELLNAHLYSRVDGILASM